MVREDLLNTEETKKTVVSSIIADDTKFIKRTINRIEDEIEDAKDELIKRLMSEKPIDSSVVEVLYNTIISLSDRKELYENFQSEFLV